MWYYVTHQIEVTVAYTCRRTHHYSYMVMGFGVHGQVIWQRHTDPSLAVLMVEVAIHLHALHFIALIQHQTLDVDLD